MKILTLALPFLATSIGIANASHDAKLHRPHALPHTRRPHVSQTSPRTCSAVQSQQGRINECGEYVPSVYDPSPVSDY